MTNEDLTTIANVGPEKADRLREAGFETVDDVKEASFMSNLRDYHENDD
jgi:LSU ribosomal protein L32E